MAEKKEKEFLFDGGPSLDEVEEMKKTYGKIYMTEIEEGEVFLWRPLNRKEFKSIMSIEGADALYREERVCEKTVVWPKKYDFTAMAIGKAGIPTLISEQVMDKSGFVAKTGPMEL